MAIGTAAIVSAGLQGAGAVVSFLEAEDQRNAQKKAEIASKEYIEKAARELEKDEFAALNVPLDAFGEQYRQNIRGQQQGIQSLQEGDPRNLAAGVGNVVGAATAGNEQTRIQMGEALYKNSKMKATSREAIKQQGIDLLTGQAADESMRARDASENTAAYTTQGMNALGSVGTTLFEGSDLYRNNKSEQNANLLSLVDRSKTVGLTDAQILKSFKTLTKQELKDFQAGGGLPDGFNFGIITAEETVEDPPVVVPAPVVAEKK